MGDRNREKKNWSSGENHRFGLGEVESRLPLGGEVGDIYQAAGNVALQLVEDSFLLFSA